MCRLLTQGASSNYEYICMRGPGGLSTTPLIQAALVGHADAARVLISRQADVNKPDPLNGITPMHAAAQGGHLPGERGLMGETSLAGILFMGLQVLGIQKQSSAY